MNATVKFFFWLAAVICFVIAAVGADARLGRGGRPGIGARLGFVPLGLALFVFPFMWDTAVQAFD